MIDLIFNRIDEIVFLRITGSNVKFANSMNGNIWSSIEGLKLDKKGVMKEFPDLKDNPEWKEEAIGRFKEMIRDKKNEYEISEYMIKELKKFGYTPKWKQIGGFRREKIK